jgi:protein TonB
MNTDAASLDHLTTRPRRERLTTTLIFAVLIHGLVLLGVGFAALVPAHPPATTVNVTVATHRADTAPHQARYLARFNQFGPGNTHVLVPERPSDGAGQPLANHGSKLARHMAELLPRPALAKAFSRFDTPRPEESELVSTSADSRLVTRHMAQPAPEKLRALSVRLAAPDRGVENVLQPSAVKLPQLYGRHPEADARTTNARQALYAPYLLAWQRRIEQVGTTQFAKLVPGYIKKGHLTLSVTLTSDGSVRSLSIIKRSSHPELDAAALKIIRLAAPFAPFPAKLRARSKTLTFTYRWNFIRHAGEGSLGLGG